MANNVIFKIGTKAQYDALAVKDQNTLYWLTDVLELRKGEILYGTGALATNLASGLMAAADKAKLDKLSEPADYTLEKLGTSQDGFSASYRLKKTVGGETSYVGDTINIPKDLVVQSGSLQTVTSTGLPYTGAQVGDPYIDLVINDAQSTHIYIPVRGLVDTYAAGTGLTIVDNVIALKLNAVEARGLYVDDNGLALALATHEADGAMSAQDKKTLDNLPQLYERIAYEIAHKPEGTIVDYRDKEIRVLCPADTQWQLQQSGENADPNAYYIGFKAYAPSDDVTNFKEDLAETISDETMYDFTGEFAGIDTFGRKYSIVWLPVAAKGEDGNWTYYGEHSSAEKYIGWYYSVQWYNAAGKVISKDTIRISLSNEDCHANIRPYYLNEYASDKELNTLKDSVASIEESYIWGAI